MMSGVEVASTGCLNMCNKGPVMIDYPSNNWYQELDEEKVDEILDAIEEGEVAEDYLMKE